MLLLGGGNSKTDPTDMMVLGVPSPFPNTDLPTIFVGGAPPDFLGQHPVDQYLDAFGYLSLPEQLRMYQVAGSRGREILATSGVCPDFACLTPGVLAAM